MNIEKLKQSIIKAAKALYNNLPVIFGVVLLVSLANSLIPKEAYALIFSKNVLLDSIAGSAIGSILLGHPITSYILGGEFLSQGVSLTAVTAFIVAWVTVGVVQLPAESMLLGKRFAIARNITAFIFAIVVAVITVGVLNLL